MTLLFLTLFFAGILYLQLPPLIKGKNIREILAYSLMMLTAIVYSYALVLDIDLPNPTKAVDAVFRPVTNFMDRLFM